MVELADTADLRSTSLLGVKVQVLLGALQQCDSGNKSEYA